MICRGCEGGKAMLKDGRVHYSTCVDCDAMLALKNGEYEHFGKKLIVKDRQMGFVDTIESAYKLCSCFANNHNGQKILEPSEEMQKVNEMAKKQHSEKEEIKQKSLTQYQQKIEEEKQYYEKRVRELKQLDEERGEPIT